MSFKVQPIESDKCRGNRGNRKSAEIGKIGAKTGKRRENGDILRNIGYVMDLLPIIAEIRFISANQHRDLPVLCENDGAMKDWQF